VADPNQFTGARRFGPFVLDLRTGELELDGTRIRLQGQPAQLLVLLVSQHGELVTREELRAKLWPEDTFVDFDHGLNNAVNRVREALGDSAGSPRYIETIPRKGYRFIGKIEDASQGSALPIESTSSGDSLRRAASPRALVMVLAIVLLVAGTASWGWYRFHERSLPARAQIQSLAVLPLANLSGDPGQEYFADGMTDELTTALAKISALRVTSRTSTLSYRDTRKPVRQIARELNVDAVVEGSVARSGNRVRITAQLIDARNDQHMWAESYERDLSDILNAQNTVAVEIAQQVRANLTSAERTAFAARSTVVPEAYDAYLRGRKELGKQRTEAFRQGLEYFQQAIVMDRLYAPAYAGLADSYSLLVNYSALPPLEAFPRARSAALKALDLDANLAEAHTSLAFVRHHFDWDWDGADAEYKLALRLDPNNAITHLRYAELLSNLGRHDEAIREITVARQLDPLSVVVRSNVGRFLYYARRYDEAIAELKQVLAADPHRSWSRVTLAFCYEQKGMYSEALAEQEALRADFNGVYGIGSTHLFARMGKFQDARTVLKYHEQPAPDGVQDWFFIAAAYAQLGEKDRAFQWLGRAYQNRDYFMTFIKTDPFMDPLREDPRFEAMLRRVGFPR
jgi:TolB-like protein/DNA-binding winged helix-turn-helix (wHTH) protein/Tfp pilus assembly protein PilF